jgi:hypothetical protein
MTSCGSSLSHVADEVPSSSRAAFFGVAFASVGESIGLSGVDEDVHLVLDLFQTFSRVSV